MTKSQDYAPMKIYSPYILTFLILGSVDLVANNDETDGMALCGPLNWGWTNTAPRNKDKLVGHFN